MAPSPSTINWTPRAGRKAAFGTGLIGILLLALVALVPPQLQVRDPADPGHRRRGETLAGIMVHPVGRIVVVGIGVILLLLAVQRLYAGVRGQVLVSCHEEGVDVWRFGRLHRTRWEDVVALSSRAGWVRLVRRRGPTLTIPMWGVPDGAAWFRAELMLWLEHRRPEDWHRIPGLRSSPALSASARPPIDW